MDGCKHVDVMQINSELSVCETCKAMIFTPPED